MNEHAVNDLALRRPTLLAGQKALVTGASSGIGRGCAVALAECGASVGVNYRSDRKGAEDAVREIESLGGTALAVGGDVSREDNVERIFAEVLEAFGTLDILVSNAGIQDDAAFDEMTLEQWNRVLAVNLTGQFLCCREAVRQFKRQGVRREVSRAAGKIVAISSVHEAVPWAGHVNYAASKGGLMLLVRSIAQEVAGQRIRVNSIAPGAVRTAINRPAWETEEAYRSLMTLIPYDRIGEPEDIGRAAAWLASDMADYVTGTTLFVDGGMTLYPGFAAGG